MSHSFTVTVLPGKTANLSELLGANFIAMDDTYIDYNVLDRVSKQTAYWSDEIHEEQDAGNLEVKINGVLVNKFHPYDIIIEAEEISDEDDIVTSPTANDERQIITMPIVDPTKYKNKMIIITVTNTDVSNTILVWIRSIWSTKDNKKKKVGKDASQNFDVKVDNDKQIEVWTSDYTNTSIMVTTKKGKHN